MNTRLAQIKSQKKFYRNRYDRVVKLLLIFLGLIICLGGMLVMVLIKQPTPAHYATSLEGGLTRLTTLNLLQK